MILTLLLPPGASDFANAPSIFIAWMGWGVPITMLVNFRIFARRNVGFGLSRLDRIVTVKRVIGPIPRHWRNLFGHPIEQSRQHFTVMVIVRGDHRR